MLKKGGCVYVVVVDETDDWKNNDGGDKREV